MDRPNHGCGHIENRSHLSARLLRLFVRQYMNVSDRLWYIPKEEQVHPFSGKWSLRQTHFTYPICFQEQSEKAGGEQQMWAMSWIRWRYMHVVFNIYISRVIKTCLWSILRMGFPTQHRIRQSPASQTNVLTEVRERKEMRTWKNLNQNWLLQSNKRWMYNIKAK